jgi:uncharacterized protein YdhG (YjbR/CyaY superfamily)
MLRPIDTYFLQQPEPTQSCMQYLRKHILKLDANVTEAWKYGMPFFCYNGKMMCYLWVHKKYHLPYIGIVEGKLVSHPDLIIEKRARMKILLLNPNEDLPMDKIDDILSQMLKLYK